jgi:hypothetical protein
LADILVIRHADEPVDFSQYSMPILCRLWREAGHRVTIVRGLAELPKADLAILHVNLSVVPDEYREAAASYKRVVNGRALDIRKRNVSRNLLNRGDEWAGEVIVKADLNFGGVPEWRVANPDLPPSAAPVELLTYLICDTINHVPEAVWSDPRLVVERFLPERDADGYCWLRTWVFLGDRGRCRRGRSKSEVIKGWEIIDTDPELLEVPEPIRAERERLGVDYGKFDFVLHEGTPVLFDANKTPGIGPSRSAVLYQQLASALDGLLA